MKTPLWLIGAMACTSAGPNVSFPPPPVDVCAGTAPGDLCRVGTRRHSAQFLSAVPGHTVVYGNQLYLEQMEADGTTRLLDDLAADDATWHGKRPPPVPGGLSGATGVAAQGNVAYRLDYLRGLVAVDRVTLVHTWLLPPTPQIYPQRADGSDGPYPAFPPGPLPSMGNMFVDGDRYNYVAGYTIYELTLDPTRVSDLVGLSGEHVEPEEFDVSGPIAETPLPAIDCMAAAGDRIFLSGQQVRTVYVADVAAGTVTRLAGHYDERYWETGGDGGPARDAAFDLPAGLAACPDGSVYVFDLARSCIRRIDADGVIDTVVGQCAPYGTEGQTEAGPALAHYFGDLTGSMACAPEGDRLYFVTATGQVDSPQDAIWALMLPAPGRVTVR